MGLLRKPFAKEREETLGRERGLTGGSDGAAAALGGSALAVLREAGIIAVGIGVFGLSGSVLSEVPNREGPFDSAQGGHPHRGWERPLRPGPPPPEEDAPLP